MTMSAPPAPTGAKPIDRILDTTRTAVNVEGDMVGALIVQKLAGRPPAA